MREGRWEYRQPADRDELLEALRGMTDRSVILAGGTDLICRIREEQPDMVQIVSLALLKELKGIEQRDGWIRIGAMATHAEIAGHPFVRRYLRALAAACAHVGSKQIRNKGTIGGNLMNASPAGDTIPCLFLLRGRAELLDAEGETRCLTAGELYRQDGRCAAKRGELLTSLWFPVIPERDSFFCKLGGRSEVTIAQLSGCMSAVRDGDGFRETEFWLGAVDRLPLAVPEAAELLNRGKVGAEELNCLSEILSGRIREIRERRKKPPRLKIRESERLYKERAVRGVVFDVVEGMRAGKI